MIHKQTGEMRFSVSDDTDTINYNGENKSLNKWKWVMIDVGVDYTLGGETVTAKSVVSYTISSSSEDAIPYKISRTS